MEELPSASATTSETEECQQRHNDRGAAPNAAESAAAPVSGGSRGPGSATVLTGARRTTFAGDRATRSAAGGAARAGRRAASRTGRRRATRARPPSRAGARAALTARAGVGGSGCATTAGGTPGHRHVGTVVVIALPGHRMVGHDHHDLQSARARHGALGAGGNRDLKALRSSLVDIGSGRAGWQTELVGDHGLRGRPDRVVDERRCTGSSPGREQRWGVRKTGRGLRRSRSLMERYAPPTQVSDRRGHRHRDGLPRLVHIHDTGRCRAGVGGAFVAAGGGLLRSAVNIPRLCPPTRGRAEREVRLCKGRCEQEAQASDRKRGGQVQSRHVNSS